MSIQGGINRFKSTFPKKIGQMMMSHYLKGFQKGPGRGGGQTDASKGGWAPRKHQAREKQPIRRILVKSKALMRDFKIIKDNWSTGTTISSGPKTQDYAGVHNDGEGRMTQREIVGDSKDFEKKIEREYYKQFQRDVISQLDKMFLKGSR